MPRASTPISSPRPSASRRPLWRSSPTAASTTCRSRSRTASPIAPTISPVTQGAFARKRALAAEVVRPENPADGQCRHSPRQYRPHRGDGDAGADARRQPRRDRACAILRLGAEEPRRADAERRAGRARGGSGRGRCAARHHGEIVIDAVVPDYYARLPKPCVGGWGRRSLNVTPAGKVLPCHAAESIPGLEFWSVREHSLADIWANSPAFNAFRGTDWMQEPCRSCARRDIDFGGCRCQAFALTGDARATDPVCHLAPSHDRVAALAARSERGSLRLPADVTNATVFLPSPLCIPESQICNFALTLRRATLPRAGIGRKAGAKADT